MLARVRTAAIALPVFLSACASPDLPRDRLGCLPFPGLFTLFELADPADLGLHHYNQWENLADGFAERERGVLYTCRAGFLDLAHVRETIDWARYMQLRAADAFAEGADRVVVHGREHTRWTLLFSYPPGWLLLAADEREAFVDAASRAVGLRMAYDVMTWHEIITWFGYRSTVVISEDRSAFTYDDVASHAVGLLVAERAMAGSLREGWDQAVTDALRSVLDELSVRSPEHASFAIEQVRGLWWRDDECLLRLPEFHPDAPEFVPHVAPGFAPCDGAPAAPIPVPTLRDVKGADLRVLLSVTLRSGVFEMGDIRRAAGLAVREPLDVNRDFPRIVSHIREQLADSEPR